MRKFYLLVAVVLVAGFVLAACQTPVAPTAAPTEAPTAAPSEAPVVAEPVAPVEPPVEEPAEPVALNPYIGSNKLDGNGVPPNFFADVHVRKGFAYAFDAQLVIDEVYNGEAIPSYTLSLVGMPGYDANAPHYSFDLEKAAEEFKLADVDGDGVVAGEDPDDIWEMGFRLQMLYNTGNTTRQIYAEILQANLAEVNEKFVIEVLGLPWPAYLTAQRAHKIPIMTGGWLEDIHDAHNWYQPYTTGTYGGRQNMPQDLKDQFKALLDEGVALVDPEARAEVYYRFNQLYYDQVPGLPVALATSHAYEQKWISGRVMNPIFSSIVYRTISKSADAKDPMTITTANIGDALTLDPAACYDTASGEVLQNIYDTLVFYDGESTDKFVPWLAESYEVSEDGTEFSFKIREGVKFHAGGDLTPSDVVYSFVRGLLQGGYSTPQWMLSEPFFGVGKDDVTMLVDDGASADDREALMANDPALLKQVCEDVKSKFVIDEATNTVTMKLAQAWGPFLPTIANNWGAIMDKEWVIENGGWDDSCDTWQNFYSMPDSENPFTPITNGTGAFQMDHWTPGQEIVLTKFADYWGEPAKVDRVVLKIIPEFGTRFAMLQAGDADFAPVPAEQRAQVDPLVSEIKVYNPETNTYDEPKPVCTIDTGMLGIDRFEICEEANDRPLRLLFGRPGLTQDVILFNFLIE